MLFAAISHSISHRWQPKHGVESLGVQQDVVLVAVRNCSSALAHAAPALRADREVGRLDSRACGHAAGPCIITLLTTLHPKYPLYRGMNRENIINSFIIPPPTPKLEKKEIERFWYMEMVGMGITRFGIFFLGVRCSGWSVAPK